MPAQMNIAVITAELPIATYTATYQINSGTAIAAGASVTDSITFTGLATTDKKAAISPRDAIAIPKGLVVTSMVITATNTLGVTWLNNTAASIAVPASATWTCVVLANFMKQ
jgi:hypothetical protein